MISPDHSGWRAVVDADKSVTLTHFLRPPAVTIFMVNNNKQLCCRKEAARCFVSVSSQLQQFNSTKRRVESVCRAMLCVSAAYAVMRCLPVCVSVTFMNHVKTNKDIFKMFSPSGSHTILVFPRQTAQQYSDGNSLTGAQNAGGVGRNRPRQGVPVGILLCCLAWKNQNGVATRW